MGKRELVLIAAFIAIGVVVYRVSAPPARSGEGFSLARLLDHVRTEIRGDVARSERATAARAAVETDTREVRLAGFRGNVTLVGEDRPDVAAELKILTRAPDMHTAETQALQTALNLEAVSGYLNITVSQPARARRPADLELTVKLPRRLGVHVETTRGETRVRDAHHAEFVIERGNLSVQNVATSVEADQRDGNVEIADVGSLRLTTRRSATRLERVTGESRIEASDGSLRAEGLGGETRLEARRVRADLTGLGAPAELTIYDGRLTLAEVRARVRLESRRAPVSVRLAAAAALDAFVTDAPLELLLPARVGVTLDAAASDGDIRLDGLVLTVTGDRIERKAAGAVGGGGPTITLRTTRGDITLRAVTP